MKRYFFKIKKGDAIRLDDYLKSDINVFSYLKERKDSLNSGWRDILITISGFSVTNDSGRQLDSHYLNNFDIDHDLEVMSSTYEKVAFVLKRKLRELLGRVFPQINLSINIQKKYFESLWNAEGVISLDKVSKRHRKLHYEKLLSYNYFNELNPYLDFCESRNGLNIVEIGPGVGNMCLVFMENCKSVCMNYVLVDLPEALPFSISHLMYKIPDANFILPHELTRKTMSDFNSKNGKSTIIFMTPEQMMELIPSKSIDVGINTNSFAEMPVSEIKKYFKKLRIISKEKSIFFTVNRVEKATNLKTQQSVEPSVASKYIHIANDDNFEIKRFDEYPWSLKDRIYAHHIEPFNKSKTTNPFYLKVVKLHRG